MEEKIEVKTLNGHPLADTAARKELLNKQPAGDYLTEHQKLKTVNGQSLVGEGNIEIAGSGGAVTQKSKRFIHMSFDDVTNVITQLATGSLNSAFENSFLAMLKEMHEQYGFVFSLYLQTNPSSVSSKYQAELREAASWLKWGLHSFNNGNYQSSSYAAGQADWNKMVATVLTLTGTHEAVDRMPRLHQFYGSEAALQGMRDAALGAIGFLSTDDTRKAYYLDQERLDWLYEGENDHLTDFENGLVFYRTDLRLDWFAGAGFTYNAAAGMSNHEPTDDSDIAGELDIRYNGNLYINTWDCFVIFTHEWQPVSAISNALTAIGEFAIEKRIDFDFPQNRYAHATQQDYNGSSGGNITVDSALNATSQNPVQNKVVAETFATTDANVSALDVRLTGYINALEERIAALESSGGATIYSVTNNLENVASDNAVKSVVAGSSYSAALTVNSGYTFDVVTVVMGGVDITSTAYSNGSIYILNVTGAIVITATATKNSGGDSGDTETVIWKSTQGSYELKVVDDMADMVYQAGKSVGGSGGGFADAVGRAASTTTILAVTGGETISLSQPISGVTLTYSVTSFIDPATNSFAAPSDDNQLARKWLSAAQTLASTTKYVLLAFKRGDGSSDFSAEEIALLQTALTIS